MKPAVSTIVLALALVAGCSGNASRTGSSADGSVVRGAHYQCDNARTIDAVFDPGTGPAAGTPPRPTGHVTIDLSDGRKVVLPQTISASGVRYANADESLVFWIKGDGALVLEHDQQKTYIGCVRVADDPGGLPRVFASGQDGFSLRYPPGFHVVTDHVYQALGPGRDIHGVAFMVDPALAQGTNLAADSYVAVESLADDGECAAGRFLDGAGPDSTVVDDGVTYAYAQATGAGAGNRYEEHVYAIPGTNPCLAVRYFVHFTVLENYPEGAVRAFDHDALIATFDAMRRTLVIAR
jgi:membrane-bound inhibitor of C-type lysozyme